MSLFQKRPELADSGSYQLHCKVSQKVLNTFVDKVYDDFAHVDVAEDNFEELQNLCEELGFAGLDQELRAFRGEIGRDAVDLKEFLQLKERVTRQDKRVTELERQFKEVLSWKRKAESVSREFQSLDRKVDEVARVCEERNVKVSRKMEEALMECAKQCDLEELARDLAQLKESQSVVQARPAMRPEVIEPQRSGLPPLNKSSSAKSRPPTLGKRVCLPNEKSSHKCCNNDVGNKAVTAEAGKEVVYKSSKPLEGIIAHLTRECGGNIHDKGIINVTASSFNGSHCQPKNAVELGTRSEYCSKNEKDTWICYDFKDRRVIPTSYSVRSCRDSTEGDHFKSWVIEVSNDGSSWTEIDHRDNNNDLNSEYATANFEISKVPSETFRFFRLRQTGQNNRADKTAWYFVAISSLEIFGTLFACLS